MMVTRMVQLSISLLKDDRDGGSQRYGPPSINYDDYDGFVPHLTKVGCQASSLFLLECKAEMCQYACDVRPTRHIN